MPRVRRSKRPDPHAYDHLWLLLPVFIAFVATVVLVVAADDRLLLDSIVDIPEAPATATAATHPARGGDASVPPAAKALAAQAAVADETPASY